MESTVHALRSHGRVEFLRWEWGLMTKCNLSDSNAAVLIWKESCYFWHSAVGETSMKYFAQMTNPTNMPWNECSTEHKALPEELITLIFF